MGKTDRRTFLANGVRAGSVAALGTVAALVTPGPAQAAAPTSSRSRAANPLGPPTGLSVNGLSDPVGIDPDDVNLAWRLTATGRSVVQQGYRIRVAAATGGHTVWDSGPVVGSRQAFVAYGGPALAADSSYRWSVQVRDGRGSSSPWATGTFVTGLRGSDWKAQWLRPGPEVTGPEEYTHLRRSFTPARSPIRRAVAYVAAAHKYQLWVNGRMVDTGPSFSFPDQSYVQATDLTGALEPGRENVVGILHHWYGPGNGRPAAIPGVLFQLSVDHADGRRELVVSDGTWRQHPGAWLPAPPRNTEANDFVEIIDGRRTPLGWAGRGYVDDHWSPAPVLGPVGSPPFTALFAQRTRIVEHRVGPAHVRTLADGTVVVDFGRIIAARPEVEFRHGVDGRTIPMHVGYLLDPDGRVSTTHGTQGTDLSFTYIQRDGEQTFVPYTYVGFRYLQIDGPGEPITGGQVAAMARHSDLPGAPRGSGAGGGAETADTAAAFSSSVPMLDSVWALCAHSALYSCQEQFVDTPTRQKGQFVEDSTNESQAVMHAFGDRNQSWQGLRDFARSQARFWPDGRVNDIYPDDSGATDIPDDTETYAEWVWRYFQRTGDTATLTALYPVVSRIADYVWNAVDPATGLVTNLPGGGTDYTFGVVDWPPAMRYGYDMATVARTEVNVLAVNVFTRAAMMAAVVGDTAGEAAFTERQLALLAAVNTRLVRSDGVYIDGLEADGTQSTHASQQANGLALAYGVVPPDRVATVGAYTASLGIALGPDHGLELVRGLHAAGLDAHIVDILTDPAGPGWAQIVQRGGTYTWESWTPIDLEQDSLSHGWGSGALAGIQEALLGVEVTTLGAPGGSGSAGGSLSGAGTQLSITAPPASLARCSGRVPTVAGPVDVAWERRRSGHKSRLECRLSVPPNATATLGLPALTAGSVTESGRPVASRPGVEGVTVAGHSSGVVDLRVGSGTYRFESVTG